uniref:phosphatidate phosphatase n=1 Tax=Rhizophora mucronata TaxID=61149 RepID=A0A2P2MF16_RHIMU
MNVVGKVGSLISQSVYTVATPFHPFGGAVDVIVVQQQDGLFRSTPWYVRFGKFQGVLKGTEKIVRINVNGIEANFHMYLDNSGEAYFIKEVESGEESRTNGSVNDSESAPMLHEDGIIGHNDNSGNNTVETGRLQHSVSDSRVVQLREECDSSRADRLDRTESDGDHRYYEFQDEQSTMEGSVEFSEFSSSRYENLDGEHIVESPNLDSEVILVSIDGHILTAPVLPSEKNIEAVESSTSQIHLGPGEGSEEFNAGDDSQASDNNMKLTSSPSNVASANVCSLKDGDNVPVHHPEVCGGDGEHVCQVQMQSHLEDTPARIKREEVFKSCLGLSELAEQVGNADVEEIMSSPEVQKSLEECSHGPPAVDHTENGDLVEFTNESLSPPCNSHFTEHDGSHNLQVEVEAVEKPSLDAEHVVSDIMSIHAVTTSNYPVQKGGELCKSMGSEVVDASSNLSASAENNSKSEIPEPQRATSSEDLQSFLSLRFEISLCGKELHAGMGSEAAAKVFEAHIVSAEEFKNSAASIIKNENLILRYGNKYLPWEKAAPIILGIAAFGLDLPVEPKNAIPVEQGDTPEQRNSDTENVGTSSSRRWRLWPMPFRRIKTLEHTSSNTSSEEIFVDTESGVQSSNMEMSVSFSGSESPYKQHVRTNTPTSEQIASLNLKDGQNVITFSFSTRVLGTQQEVAHIYLWKWNTRIVISDVDGTITKSDVLGQFMPLVGRDWSQSGVATLFSAIKENGYQLLFLSARAIVQAYLTRSFLFNLKQDGKTLPNGPVFISPDGLFPSLYREGEA